jgi:lipopolysaccharide/colanic/teichoic acid biosynthesis glycosyltransferase
MTAPIRDFQADLIRSGSAPLYPAFGKRGLDILLVIAALPVLIPAVLLIAALLRAAGGPAFYVQPRVGRGGRLFFCWKFRTMNVGADGALARILAEDPTLAAEWASFQKLADDPRVTRLGRVLRRTSLDEIPQLWNVLRGDMSLVGPRPFTPDQVPLYLGGRRDVAYYRMRPGLTGLWQVGPRNSSGFAERALADHDYSESLSLRGDLAILVRTVGVVLAARGR